ncbi:hypothetical protein AB0B07_33400 [Streptomyces sioyaensis]|uniref:hypothetical protein n=1 Tax=Streptomyces sioyaensis TaxID=67364 RepID=UPI0033E8D084
MSSNFSPKVRRSVIKGAVANVLEEHAGSPDLASLLADAVNETLIELDSDPADTDAGATASN